MARGSRGACGERNKEVFFMPTVEKILEYFGTYTPGVDGAVSAFKFEYLTSLGFAAIVIFLGHAIVKRSAMLRKFAIPAPVVSGLLFSIVIAILKGSGLIAISFNVSTIQDLCQNIFFMCVASALAGSSSATPAASCV